MPRRQCVVREVREELGIEVVPGRLLVIDDQHPEPDRTAVANGRTLYLENGQPHP